MNVALVAPPQVNPRPTTSIVTGSTQAPGAPNDGAVAVDTVEKPTLPSAGGGKELKSEPVPASVDSRRRRRARGQLRPRPGAYSGRIRNVQPARSDIPHNTCECTVNGDHDGSQLHIKAGPFSDLLQDG